MKTVALMALALCSAFIACTGEDTGNVAEWRRTVEPRLTHATRWSAYAPAAAPPAQRLCERDVKSRGDALDAIAHEPECLGQAIDLLDQFPDRGAKSDLAAAYYVRWQLEHSAVDLLDAWEAVRNAEGVPEAQFNFALIQEALGLPEEAQRTWAAYAATDASEWGKEAREHSNRLQHEMATAGSVRWPQNRRALPAALAAGDRAKVAELIRDFPAPAQTYLEDVVIPQWARSGAQKDLDAAKLLAEEVSKREQDPFAADVVAAIVRGRDRDAYLAYDEARRLERALERKDAITPYEKAVELLRRAHSPLRINAEMALAIARMEEKVDAEPALQRLLQESDKYPHTAAVVRGSLAYVRNDKDNSVHAREDYHAAMDTFFHLNDPEFATAMQSGMSGTTLEIGDEKQAWQEAWETNRYASAIADLRRRHVRFGALNDAARELGHPSLALLYQNQAVAAAQQALADEPVENLDVITGLRQHLAIAYRRRAEARIALDPDGALIDVENAIRLTRKDDTDNSRYLRARNNAVRGSILLGRDDSGALSAFSEALTILPEKAPQNLRIEFLTRLSDAQRRLGRRQEAQATLKSALKLLDLEERAQLANAGKATSPDIWSSYFHRFQESYRLLVDLMVSGGDTNNAFAYVERAKAFEPLTLVRKLPYAPRRFLELTKGAQPIALKEIQNALPADTYLFDYCVLEGETLVWIVSHDSAEVVPIPATRDEIAQWARDIQDAAQQPTDHSLKRRVVAPYLGLLDTPLSKLARMQLDEERRIVIIPDGPMLGLPFNALRHPTRGYLVEQYIPSVQASATLYVFSLLRDAELQKGNASALLVGDPKRDLRGAQKEVDGIRPLYAPNVTVRQNANATVPDFLSKVSASDICHIAAHGEVDEKHPSKSAILFAPTKNDDGRLNAVKLAGLQLPRTRLVVLASCSSAGGAPVGPEGVGPLVRPFIGAGVPGIVGSLWAFDDATAERLLVSFHRHYRATDGDAAKALRLAQLEALDKNESLLSWAAFEVIGYASSPLPAPAAGTKEKVPP